MKSLAIRRSAEGRLQGKNPKTGRLSRREYLGLYIYSNPTEKFQQEYNRSIMQKAELIKCRRTESIINEEFFDKRSGRAERGSSTAPKAWRAFLTTSSSA